METLNLCSIARQFSDEAAAWEAVEEMLWPEGPVCPHCGDVGRAYFLKARSGERRTKAGNVTYRRLWKCKACRKPFSVLVGTIFQDTKVPLSKWLMAIFMMVSAKNGVAAFELHRTLNVTNTTAWHMFHRIREAMKQSPVADMLRGTVAADETFIGGNPSRMNKKARARWEERKNTPHSGRTSGMTDKAPVLSLVNVETGVIRSKVVARVDGHNLRKAIAEQVDMAGSVLWTDEGAWYNQLGEEFIAHHAVNHSAGQYVNLNNGTTTNKVESYFSQLKRSLDGTHHHVSKEHLHRYLSEHDFRYSTCKMNDSARMKRLMGQTVGKHLPYRVLTNG